MLVDTYNIHAARALLPRIETATNARAAWRIVDEITRLHRQVGRMAAGRATRAWGHRPCAKVGLKTKPFHVVRTAKRALRDMGRFVDGHRRVRAAR